MRILALLFAAMCAIPWSATAAAEPEVSVTLNATPSEARVGDSIRLEVRVRARGGNIQDLELSDLKKHLELEIVSHQTMRPMQFSFGFGSGVQKESSIANIYVLLPRAAGTYEFAPAVAKVDGKIYRSEPLTLVIRPSAGDARGPSDTTNAPDSSLGADFSGARYDPRAFLRTVVEPTEVYIGQQVNLTVYLYTRIRLAPQSVVPSKPSMDGFWVHDDPITSLQFETVSVKGQQYRAYPIQRSAAFPQRAGELTIGPPKISFDAGTGNFFDAPQRIERVGVPVTVQVKPLPPPVPANAVVGNYAIEARLDRRTVKTGDAVTLRVDAGGVGNVQDLRIDLPPIAGVRILQPAIRDQQRLANGQLSGTRSWEWILIAESPGAHSVPPIELHFFDPDTEAYQSTRTAALGFTATGETKPPEPTIEPVDAPAKPSTATFGPIRVYSALTREQTPVRNRTWFAWFLALPPALFVLAWFGAAVSRRRERRGTTSGAVQRKLIRDAESALQADDPRAFYDRIVASITHALDARLDEPVAGLPHTQLLARLTAEGFDDDLMQRLTNELEGADFARFAASGVNRDEMERCLKRTSAIIERIQRSGSAS
ncbi:MAG: BatD family protein [Polyangiales bacterium]